MKLGKLLWQEALSVLSYGASHIDDANPSDPNIG
jgi:hypothetical protein